MIEDMPLRNLAERTIETYVDRVAAFAHHFGTSPEHLGPEYIRAFLLHLVEAEDDRELPGGLDAGDAVVDPRTFEGGAVEQAEGAAGLVEDGS